jgi:hypothetical protein
MLEFWTSFKERLESLGGALRSRKPAPQSWQTFAIGRTGFELQAFASPRDKYLKAQLFIYRRSSVRGWNAAYYYDFLSERKDQIAQELGFSPTWIELGEESGYHIGISLPDSDPLQRDHWPTQHAWLAEKLEALARVFRPLIAKLPTLPSAIAPE